MIHVDDVVPGFQLGQAFKRHRPAEPTPAPDSARAAENLVVGEHLKGRCGGLQYESGGEGAHDHMRPAAEFSWGLRGFPSSRSHCPWLSQSTRLRPPSAETARSEALRRAMSRWIAGGGLQESEISPPVVADKSIRARSASISSPSAAGRNSVSGGSGERLSAVSSS